MEESGVGNGAISNLASNSAFGVVMESAETLEPLVEQLEERVGRFEIQKDM
jgi:hypothetical protein